MRKSIAISCAGVAAALAVFTVGLSYHETSAGKQSAMISSALGKLHEEQIGRSTGERNLERIGTFTFRPLEVAPKFGIRKIISMIAERDDSGLSAATRLDSVYGSLSRIPRILVSPKTIEADPDIQINGDYLNHVPVVILTFEGVHPQVQVKPGQRNVGHPTSYNAVFDVNTGEFLMGFTSS